jgi:hypothetical protein
MKHRDDGTWITLNTSYCIGSLCDPATLLDDASLFLNSAHGITQSFSDLLEAGVDIDSKELAQALWGASMLIEMGQRSAEEAHVRIQRMRKSTRHDPP